MKSVYLVTHSEKFRYKGHDVYSHVCDGAYKSDRAAGRKELLMPW